MQAHSSPERKPAREGEFSMITGTTAGKSMSSIFPLLPSLGTLHAMVPATVVCLRLHMCPCLLSIHLTGKRSKSGETFENNPQIEREMFCTAEFRGASKQLRDNHSLDFLNFQLQHRVSLPAPRKHKHQGSMWESLYFLVYSQTPVV